MSQKKKKKKKKKIEQNRKKLEKVCERSTFKFTSEK